MKNRIRMTAVMVMTAVLLLPVIVLAADTSVSISGGGPVKEGETTTVTVTYKGDSLGFVDGELRYDSDSLEYLSGGSSQGNSGVVQLKRWSDNASGVITFSLKFRGIHEGTVDLDLKTYETQNLDGIGMSRPSANQSVKVMEGEQQTTAVQTETQETTTAVTETQTEETESAGQEDLATVESEWNTTEEPVEAEEAKDTLPTYLPIVIAIVLIIIIIAVVVIRKKKR